MKRLDIPGVSGKLEAILDLPDGCNQCVVLCHPHPMYGGTMDDHVVSNMASAIIASGIGVVRFNFRGVGTSEGTHDKGRGETDDLLAVADYLKQQCGVTSIIVGGYSFGAVVALNAIEKTNAVSAILVAPPVKVMDTGATPDIPTLVVLGELDDIVDVTQTAEFFNQASVTVIKNADHFFAGADSEIQNCIEEFIGGS